MPEKRRAGIIFFKVNGVQYDAKGSFSYNMGVPKREGMVGSDGFHGYKEMPQLAYIEGEITDRNDLDLKQLYALEDTTITLELANGKVVTLRDAYFAGEGTAQSDEATVPVRFEGPSADEVQ